MIHTGCEEILNNEKVVEIFKGDNTGRQLMLANCLKQKHFNYFVQLFPLTNTILNQDILRACREDAWTEALRKFIIEVKEGRFDASISGYAAYYKKIYKNSYLNMIVSETKKMTVNKDYPYSKQEKPLAFKDEFSFKTYSILKRTGQQCFDYFSWKYLDGFSLDNIATATGKTIKTIKTEMYRCRKDFKLLYGKYPN